MHVKESLVQVLREAARKGASLDLVVNREALMSQVAIGGWLGHSDHKVVEFQVMGSRRKTAIKTSTLGMGRADAGLLKELIEPLQVWALATGF